MVDAFGTRGQQACDILDRRVVRDSEEGLSPDSGFDKAVPDEKWL